MSRSHRRRGGASNRSPHRAAPQASSPKDEVANKLVSNHIFKKWRTTFVVGISLTLLVVSVVFQFPIADYSNTNSSSDKRVKLSHGGTSGNNQIAGDEGFGTPSSSGDVTDDSSNKPNLDTKDKTCSPTTKGKKHCREIYPDPPKNPAINQQTYEPLKSLSFDEKLTEVFDSSHDASKNVLKIIKSFVIKTLAKYNKFRPPNPELEQADFQTVRSDMSFTNLAGNYHICDKGKEKNGRSTLLRSMKEERYADINCARTVSIWDRYPSECLDEYESFIKNDLIDKLDILEDDDLDTYSGLRKYEDRTGIIAFFPKLLLNIKKYGCIKRGVCKAVELNIDEIAFYEGFKEKGKPNLRIRNPMEMLHGKHLDFWKSGIDGIKNQGESMVALMKKLMFNKNPQSFTWIPFPHVSSWAPNIGGLTPVNLEERGEQEVANTLWESIKRVITSNMSDPNKMIEEISQLVEIPDVQINNLATDVAGVISQVQDLLDTYYAQPATTVIGGNQIVIVTEYIYYRISGGRTDSFFDPLGTVEKGWDTSSLKDTKGIAIGRMSDAVDELIAGHGSEDDAHLYVPYIYFDTNSVAFGDLEGAEALIRGKGYRPLGVASVDDDKVEHGFEFGQMKPFWFW